MNCLYYNDTISFLEEYENNDNFSSILTDSYRKLYNSIPDIHLINSWKGSIEYIHGIIKDLVDKKGISLEYIIPASGERADAILIGMNDNKPSIEIIEMKGWRKFNRYDNQYFVYADNKREIDPVYQVLNYEGKIRFSVNNINNYKIDSLALLYNINGPDKPHDKLYYKNNRNCLINKIREDICPGFNEKYAHEFINSGYVQNKNLFDAVRLYYNDIMNGAMSALAANGYGLYSEQLGPYMDIIDNLVNNGTGNYIIHGGPGSGKTLMAINLLLRSESLNKTSVLAYRNNRMVASLRKIMDNIKHGLSVLIKFYSTGRPGNPGIAEDDFINNQNTKFDIAIFDEAQRMTINNIKNAGNIARISVFFYDDSQILGKNEEGTRDNFIKYLDNPVEINLKGIYRNGSEYRDFVNEFLSGRYPERPEYYDLRYFDNINDMIKCLKNRVQSRKKAALVASFTEARGDIKNPNSIENIRIGHPLKSGLDIYKNSNLTIKWLMDPRKDYAPFWVDGISNNLDKCASVYGSQGFESDYTGVIWGRDLVWRNNKWTPGDNCEDFEIKRLFYKARDGDLNSFNNVINLLINRYRILLTRGISGTYIFCEDRETGDHIKNIIKNSMNGEN